MTSYFLGVLGWNSQNCLDFWSVNEKLKVLVSECIIWNRFHRVGREKATWKHRGALSRYFQELFLEFFPVYLAYVEKICFVTLMKGFSWRNLEGVKKKKPSEKLLFETFCLTNVKSKSIEVLKYFSGLLWCWSCLVQHGAGQIRNKIVIAVVCNSSKELRVLKGGDLFVWL